MFLNCPAYLDQEGAVRCGLPAEVRCRFTMRSTDGPVESAMIRCPAGHYFCGAIESLTWDGKDKHDPGTAAVTSPAGRDSLQRGHDGRRRYGRVRRPGFPRRAGAERSPPEHCSRVLSGPPGRPVDHRHAPAPQAHRLPLPAGSRRQRRSPNPGLRRAPAQLTPQSSAQVTAAARQGQDSPIQPAAQAAPTRCHARSRPAAQHPEHDRRAGCPLDARANGWPSGPDDALRRQCGGLAPATVMTSRTTAERSSARSAVRSRPRTQSCCTRAQAARRAAAATMS